MDRRTALNVGLLFVTGLLSGAVSAHVGAQETRAPFLIDGDVIGAGTTWGVTLVEDDVALRTCDEATDGITQFMAHVGDDRILIGTTEGLFATTNGCASILNPFFTDVPFLVSQGDDPSAVSVATDGDDGDKVHQSLNGGQDWATVFERTDFDILSILSARNGTRALIAGYDLDAGLTPRLFVVDNLVAQELAIDFGELDVAFVNVVGTDERTEGERFALSLIAAAQTSSVVLLDVDAALAGQLEIGTHETVAAFDEVVTHYASSPTGRAVLLNRRTFMSQLGETAFKAEATGPTRCLLRAASGSGMVGCGTDEAGDAVGTSDDGRTWTWDIPFVEVEDRLCPSGTVGRVRCAYLFPGLDAGPLPSEDAGAEEDAGSDGGTTIDDGGEVTRDDAGDSGVEAEDAGVVVDAGGAVDPEPGSDGGVSIPPRPCSCGHAPARDASAPLAGIALLAIAFSLRRRRHDVAAR